MIKYLAKKKANIEITDKLGWQAFMYAASKGNLDCLKHLIEEYDLDVNVKGNDDDTAILFASLNGHTEVVKYLANEAGAAIGI